MSTILLQTAGAALGSPFGPLGAIVGRAVGGLAGSAIDQALFGQSKTISSPGLKGARISSADEGAPITRLYGTMRVTGNLIWATRFEEDITSERQGGKSTNSGTNVETKTYYANLALGLCEGEISHIKRIWADGREIDQSQIDMRVYHGTQDQLPDPLMEAKQGAGQTPAYRGLAYVVLDRLPIEAYGNRIPVLQFEITKSVGQLERVIRAVTLIPSATEHGLATIQISETPSVGQQRLINHNVKFADNDLKASLDELQSLCPNLQSIGLVISWFGNDLRAGSCKLQPGVEVNFRNDETRQWRVGSKTRGNAYLISRQDNAPIYGGTPDDASVLDAIVEIKSRGLNVTLYPFILMDVPEGNQLPSPYGADTQAIFPWRGRITCDPAIGQPNSVDQTFDAGIQIARFLGASQTSDFVISGNQISWTNADYGCRHMILHYAALAKIASNIGAPVDGFVLGSEMVALTRVRDHQNIFPFVQALADLSDDVASILSSSTQLTYAADWTEYFGYHPQDGSGDVWFHLDDLWAKPSISAIGIDNYMPLSDWRDDDLQSANPDGFRHQNDVAALSGQIDAGEGFDYYYADTQARADRDRTPITDGLGKPWIYRFKDLKSWWENPHYNRIGGVEVATSTAWVPQSKPFWLTEFGCPAVDKGANQPIVFPDPKSSENAFPHFSNKGRSDQAQRAFLSAHLNHWNADNSGMVDLDHSYVWTWDARPFPVFPQNLDLWSDEDNWRTGHWINGRLGTAPLNELIANILTDHGFAQFDVSAVEGIVTGYVQADVTSARAMLEPLMTLFQIDVSEGAENLIFASRMTTSKNAIDIDALCDQKDEQLMSHRRGQESELANEVQIDMIAPELDYTPASTYSRRLARGSQRQELLRLPAALDSETISVVADQWLQDHWASREVVEFSLPLEAIHFEPGDRVRFSNATDFSGPDGVFSIVQIEDGTKRNITAKRIVSSTALASNPDVVSRNNSDANAGFSPNVVLLDLPILSGSDPLIWARGAAYASPWVPITLSSSITQSGGYSARAQLRAPATIGRLTADLSAGPEGRIDYKNNVVVQLPFGEFETITKGQILAGQNIIAVKSKSRTYEIIQFQDAVEIATNQWQLSNLLRAQSGTDGAMEKGASSGAEVVLINGNVTNHALSSSELDAELYWQVGGLGKSNEDIDVITFTGGARANTPFSPVHLRAIRQPDGIMLTWKRRSRFNADSWLGADVPVDEDELRYRLDIMNGSNIIGTVEISAHQYLYSVADELSDFMQTQAQITFSVTQIGGQIASGISRRATKLL